MIDRKPEMVTVPAGTFRMGSVPGEGGTNEHPQHTVELPAFAMGCTPVTQALYTAIVGHNPSRFKGATRPVEEVSWLDAVLFCNALSEQEGLPLAYSIDGETIARLPSPQGYHLPSEAEWEYACRAESTARWSHGDHEASLSQYAWFGEKMGTTHPVAQKEPNSWGLYDMHGNVWEWCNDGYTETYSSGSTQGRARRGGSFWNSANACRSAFRGWGLSDFKVRSLGFRVVLCVPNP